MLLTKEIKHIENLLDSNAPRVQFPFGDLLAVRRAYDKHIVEGNSLMRRYARAKDGDEIALWSTGLQPHTSDDLPPGENEDITDFSNARKYKLIDPAKEDVKALNIAEALFTYLQWLRELGQPEDDETFIEESDETITEEVTEESGETIIRRCYLELIFIKYGRLFDGEDIDTWFLRFRKGSVNVRPINIAPSVKGESNKLILIAILASIQDTTGGAFGFEEFVNSHFGIKAYQSTRSKNKEKPLFKDTYKAVNRILAEMTKK